MHRSERVSRFGWLAARGLSRSLANYSPPFIFNHSSQTTHLHSSNHSSNTNTNPNSPILNSSILLIQYLPIIQPPPPRIGRRGRWAGAKLRKLEVRLPDSLRGRTSSLRNFDRTR